jgi:hypothetical protein
MTWSLVAASLSGFAQLQLPETWLNLNRRDSICDATS